MAVRSRPRSRMRAFACLLLTVALGLLSRRYPLPGVLAQHTGDALYTVAAFFGGCLLVPAARANRLAAAAFGWSVAVELSQLLPFGWLADLRATRLGALVLGQGFLVADLFAYAIGAAVAWLVDVTIRRRLPRGPQPPDKLPHLFTR